MASKSDLRRLMQHKKASNKVDHPLARYSNTGNLSCIICNISVKSELVWPAHLQSRRHKEAVADLKSKKSQPIPELKSKNSRPKVQSPKTESTVQNVKRKEPAVTSSSQGSHAGLPMDFFDPPRKTEEIGKKRHSNNSEDKLEQKKKIRTETIRTLHSSKNSTQDTKKPQIKDTGSDKEIKTSGLPSDFFDTGLPRESDVDDSVASKSKESVVNDKTETKSVKASEVVPEGFFDDPKQDAKARNVEYKDPKEEEWEKFQKMIQVESKVAETLKEEEEEESERVKDLTELAQFTQCLTRVDQLMARHKDIQKTGKIIHKQTPSKDNDSSSDNTDDELEDLFDWRAKKA